MAVGASPKLLTPDQVAERLDAGDQMLTPREAATLFRVDPKTVSRWIRNRVLPGSRTPSGRYRVFLSDLRAAVERHNADVT
jgi:excisionase family DNA binding protein